MHPRQEAYFVLLVLNVLQSRGIIRVLLYMYIIRSKKEKNRLRNDLQASPPSML